jgi:hemin uptake protein HemP
MWDSPHLVGGIPTPLKNMSSSVGIMRLPTEWKNTSYVTNHQPDITNHQPDMYSNPQKDMFKIPSKNLVNVGFTPQQSIPITRNGSMYTLKKHPR